MSVVAHIGPPPGVSGGPAGYLRQLAAAFALRASSDVRVLFPPPGSGMPQATPVRSSSMSALDKAVRRIRRTLLGAPRFHRPDMADVRKPGGALEPLFSAALAQMRHEIEASLAFALAERADVFFTHSLAAAEAALSVRTSQQVWLMLHAPMPFGLYLAWSWSVPEVEWAEILTFPDVRTLVDRELDVCSRVDRIVIPCPEAIDEFVRCDRRFESIRQRADFVMTGAQRATTSLRGSRDGVRARYGLPLDQPVGLFLGNQEPYRGLDRLLKGVEALDDPRVVPGAIAIAGPDPRNLPSTRRVRAIGRVNDVPALLDAVDFVVNVNRFNLFDLSVIESLEAARPLLLHATGGNRAFARLGAGCELLADLEASTIATGLEWMFTQPRAALEALGSRSRACYDAHLTLDAFREAHERLYAAALDTVPAR